ncbi:MAG: glucuronate isomerase [Candidatus Nanopelagicaceae bacterium]
MPNSITDELYSLVKDLPIISPHGHVDAKLILENKPFDNPSSLFIYEDHYITRLLHANGYSLDLLGKGKSPDHLGAWKILCANWHLFAGTASGYWFAHQLSSLFGINENLSEANANSTFEKISKILKTDDFRPQSLLKKFNIQFLATTDDPIDDLASHAALAQIKDLGCKVVPTFRPDKYLDPRLPNWITNIENLISKASLTEVTYQNYISALENRREFFIKHGAVSADHGVYEPFTCILSTAEATDLFNKAIKGNISSEEARAFAGHMLLEMARMSTEDGLVMTIHAGVFRNHSTQTFATYGPDTGQDIPIRTEFTHNIHPLLERYGLNPNLHLILFCLDEETVTREVAPLASFYPSVFIGAPWWFFDSPSGIRRHRESVTDIAGFYRGSGFIDDTRAFLSIPARHDLSRRVDSSYLADLVAQGRLNLELAKKISLDLVMKIPTEAFKL